MQTITHRVRTFLRRQGAAIEPWSGLDETYSELHALLDRRRDDPAFWGPLEELLREVLRQATAPEAERRLAAPTAELLSSWDAAELVVSLREALSGAAPSDAPLAAGTPEYRRFTRRLSPAVLGGFLTLGLAAAGCSDHDAEPEGSGGASSGGVSSGGVSSGGVSSGGVSSGGVSSGGVSSGGVSSGGAGGGAASSGGGGTGGGGGAACVIEDAQVLASTINDSTLEAASKSSLCACMTNLTQSWRDGLTTLFERGDAAAIATALEEMLLCCARQRTSGVYAEGALLDGTLCELGGGMGGVVYKGVSFPS